MPAGTVSASISVVLLDDELDESFLVSLTQVSEGELVDAEAQITIVDDDQSMLTIDDLEVLENDAGNATTVLQVRTSARRADVRTQAGRAQERSEEEVAGSQVVAQAAGEGAVGDLELLE